MISESFTAITAGGRRSNTSWAAIYFDLHAFRRLLLAGQGKKHIVQRRFVDGQRLNRDASLRQDVEGTLHVHIRVLDDDGGRKLLCVRVDDVLAQFRDGATERHVVEEGEL
jgi:hypothetical protein